MSKNTPFGLLFVAIMVYPFAVVLDRLATGLGIKDTSWLLSVLYLVPVLAVVATGWALVNSIRERKLDGKNIAAMIGGLGLTLLCVAAGYIAWALRDF